METKGKMSFVGSLATSFPFIRFGPRSFNLVIRFLSIIIKTGQDRTVNHELLLGKEEGRDGYD